MSMDSIWEYTARRVHFDALKGNKNTDVLIIGSGIAGILCDTSSKMQGRIVCWWKSRRSAA